MENENNTQTKTVETYAEDMAEAIKESGGSLVKKIIEEQEKKEKEERKTDPETTRNKTFLFLGVALTLIAAGLLTFLIVSREKITTVEIEPQFTSVIFLDKSSFLEVGEQSPEAVSGSVADAARLSEVKVGGIEGLYPTETGEAIGLHRFLEILKSNFPANGSSIVESSFLLGVMNNEFRDPFLLLGARSFADVFPVMRSWEEKMFEDLHELFFIPVNRDTVYLLTKGFEDGIIQNKNARMLRDNWGNIIMMYVFLDDNDVLITNTEDVVREVILRLAASKVKK